MYTVAVGGVEEDVFTVTVTQTVHRRESEKRKKDSYLCARQDIRKIIIEIIIKIMNNMIKEYFPTPQRSLSLTLQPMNVSNAILPPTRLRALESALKTICGTPAGRKWGALVHDRCRCSCRGYRVLSLCDSVDVCVGP